MSSGEARGFTESETAWRWRTRDEPDGMYDALCHIAETNERRFPAYRSGDGGLLATDRKFRLLACAMWRAAIERARTPTEEQIKESRDRITVAIESAERMADGAKVEPNDRYSVLAAEAIDGAWRAISAESVRNLLSKVTLAEILRDLFGLSFRRAPMVRCPRCHGRKVVEVLEPAQTDVPEYKVYDWEWARERRSFRRREDPCAHCHQSGYVFGMALPAGPWRDIAERIYRERDFDAMPILADAVEEAGCEDVDLLAHCRSDGPHALGCWAIDLLLGKS